MEKQKSFRGFIEKQKSFPVVVERQLSFMGGGEKKKSKESPGKRGDLLLHLTAGAGNLSRVEEILQNCDATDSKVVLSRKNQEGGTTIYVAAENGHALVVREILKYMDLETASIAARNGYDPFHVAAKQVYLEVLKELLGEFPNLVMTTDLICTTALHPAAAPGHIDVVNFLLETDSNLTKIARNNKKTVLHSAARVGHLEELKSLVSKDPRSWRHPFERPREAPKYSKATLSRLSNWFQSPENCKETKRLHISGLNHAINSATVVAVLIASVAFAAIFTVPEQYVEEKKGGFSVGKAPMAKNAAFIVFFVFDSLTLFISLAVAVVQTSVVVTEEKAKRACVCDLTSSCGWPASLFHSRWLAVCITAIGSSIMLTTIGFLCCCVIWHKMEEKKLRNTRKAERKSCSDPEILNSEYKRT
ncbi:Ankyrin repeat-containing protein [Melia azedarach]|uniref:Ankyrin repeat-containing protein n=1 Tax=Melia azedarach TaxID=155640 RepID=A0ACC1YLB3_MELAZ|nr:Ankyrin repeat-containing protein [Melia azedarach]